MDRFYSEELIVSFPDSIHLYLDYEGLPKDTGYCMLVKQRGNRYQVTYWMAHRNEGFVDPEWYKDLLKMRIRRNDIMFSYKKQKVNYRFQKVLGTSEYLLIRNSN